MLAVRIGRSWRAMAAELATTLRDELRSPFASARVLVDSPGSARLLSQEIASIEGISAGVEFLTVGRFLRELAERGGVGEEWEAWRSTRLATTIWEELDEVAAHHPLLSRFLSRPGRKLSAATRFARLFRRYLDEAPGQVSHWLLDRDDSAIGHELPEHLAWQPELMRRTCAALGFDPIDFFDALTAAAKQDETPTWLFTLDEVPQSAVPLIAAIAPRGAWFIDAVPKWFRDVPHAPENPLDGEPSAPQVEIHGSHSRLRQAEVLRDVLTRHFENDPTLQPRDVRVVCPNPAAWGPVLNSVFRGEGAHPGLRLRFAEVAPEIGGNHAVDALVTALELLDDRATATQVVEFLLLPAIAGRWGFAGAREDLLTLVSEAQIRWGLDGAQRGRFGLADTEYNTWLKGLDALLTGVAMGDDIGPPGVTGVEITTSSDLGLLGALSEVVSRLRALAHETNDPLTVPEWCDVAAVTLERFVGLGFDDAWMSRQALGVLDRLSRAHQDSTARFTRREFRRLLVADLPSRWHRPALGNGSLHVVAPHEVRHVDARLVAFIGLGASPERRGPDEIPGLLPDDRASQFDLLAAHARAAEQVVMVAATRSERTGAKRELPVAISWLCRKLDVEPEFHEHAPQAFNPAEFDAPGSFDEHAWRGAAAKRGNEAPRLLLRRREAMSLPIGDAPERVSLDELKRFLQHPHKAFLKSRAGISLYAEPEIEDTVPLELSGLAHWKVLDAYLQGAMRHEDRGELERRQAARQVFPPLELGRGASQQLAAQAGDLAGKASRYTQPGEDTVPVELRLGATTLTGSVLMHGSNLVRPSASGRAHAQLMPWLELLVLAAQGVRATAYVLRAKSNGVIYTSRLTQPDTDTAIQLLEVLMAAYRMGHSRLLPVPFDAAYRIARETFLGDFDMKAWSHPRPGDRTKWWPEELWSLFYEEPRTQIILDEPGDDDPDGEHPSKLVRWALALYLPLVEKGGQW